MFACYSSNNVQFPDYCAFFLFILLETSAIIILVYVFIALRVGGWGGGVGGRGRHSFLI